MEVDIGHDEGWALLEAETGGGGFLHKVGMLARPLVCLSSFLFSILIKNVRCSLLQNK